jgi:hypothetical protein
MWKRKLQHLKSKPPMKLIQLNKRKHSQVLCSLSSKLRKTVLEYCKQIPLGQLLSSLREHSLGVSFLEAGNLFSRELQSHQTSTGRIWEFQLCKEFVNQWFHSCLLLYSWVDVLVLFSQSKQGSKLKMKKLLRTRKLNLTHNKVLLSSFQFYARSLLH